MLIALLIRWAVMALAFAVTSSLLSGMDVTGGFWGYVWVSALFGIINAVIGTIIRIFTLPLEILTLGLLSVFINAGLLELTDAISGRLTIDEFFWTAIWAAIILAVVGVVLELLVRTMFRRPAT